VRQSERIRIFFTRSVAIFIYLFICLFVYLFIFQVSLRAFGTVTNNDSIPNLSEVITVASLYRPDRSLQNKNVE